MSYLNVVENSMKHFVLASCALALVATVALPVEAQQRRRLTKEQLIEHANKLEVCGEDRTAIDAYYADDSSDHYKVVCGDATGIVPLAAGALGFGAGGVAAAVAGVGLLAVAGGGGGGSSPDTQ